MTTALQSVMQLDITEVFEHVIKTEFFFVSETNEVVHLVTCLRAMAFIDFSMHCRSHLSKFSFYFVHVDMAIY